MSEIKMRKPTNTMARSESSVERRRRQRRQQWIHKNTFFSPFFGTEHHVKHETVSCSVSHFGSLNTSATFKSHIVINHLWKITTNFLFRAHTKRTLKNHSHFLSYMCVFFTTFFHLLCGRFLLLWLLSLRLCVISLYAQLACMWSIIMTAATKSAHTILTHTRSWIRPDFWHNL